MKRLLTLAALSVATAALAQNQLRAQVYATGLSLPVAMVQDPTNPSVQMVVQQRGLVKVVVNGVVQASNFLDLSGIVHQSDSEGGLLGLAFHPNYVSNRFFYVDYTDIFGDTHIVRYQRDANNPLLANPASATAVLFIDQPFSNHNGGTLNFGPTDHYLYIGMGDGGSGNDPGNRAQTITNMLLGKMLRIDVDGDDFPADPDRNYHNPSSNPFVGTTGDDEIWAFGLRNPWKWSFDDPTKLGTGGMLIGDVGQNAWEEVDYEPPLAGGRNYGWRVWEGNHSTGLGGGTGPFTFPITEYDHSLGIAVTGGYVYRGLLLGDFFGKYFFADYGSTRFWSLDLVIDPGTGEGSAANVTELTADLNSGAGAISSINVDSQGEIYLCDYRGSGQGRILKVMPENRVWATSVVSDGLTPINGDLRALSSADGKYLLTRAGIRLLAGAPFKSSFFLNMATDVVAPSFFDVFIDVGATQFLNPGGLTVFMRNWTTGALDQIGAFPVMANLATDQIIGIPAANYRRPADGVVQLYFQALCTGPLLIADPFLRYDRVKVAVR